MLYVGSFLIDISFMLWILTIYLCRIIYYINGWINDGHVYTFENCMCLLAWIILDQAGVFYVLL